MLGFIVRRILAAIPVLLVVAILTFALMQSTEGGPFDANEKLNDITRAQLEKKFGLNKPLWFNTVGFSEARSESGNPLHWVGGLLDSQFFNYMGNAAKGDFGPTYKSRGSVMVQDVIRDRFPTSIKLGLTALVFAVLVGIPFGVISALRQNTIIDYFSLVLTTIGISVPSFVMATFVILILSRQFNIKPIPDPTEWDGYGTVYFAPAMVLGFSTLAYVTRLTRSAMLEVKRQDYVRTAQAKGLGSMLVIVRHMLRNALIPVVTILGPALANLVTGSFIIESIFNVNGLGREFVNAIGIRDYSMIMGSTLFFALLIVMANVLVDVTYGFLDPRIRAGS